MNQRKHLTLVAAVAALLASMPLATVFEAWTWLVDAVLMVAALCGTAVLVRSLRAPVWAPTLAMLGSMVIVLTWLFPSREEFAGIIPTTGTFANFNDLLVTAASEMSSFAAPVSDRDGFLFLTTLGVGGVTIVIDLFAVVLRKPALAGLPMLAIYSVPVAVDDQSVSLVPFALGAAGFLWLLVTDNVDRVRRFGRRFTGDGRDVDLWEPSPLAAAGQRLAAIGIAAAVILPLAVPGMTTGLLDRVGSGGAPGAAGGRPGSGGDSVSLFAVLNGELNRGQTLEMIKVTTNDPKPFYLRFGVADELSSSGFRAGRLGGQPSNRGIPTPQTGPGVSSKAFRATIEVLNLDIPYLPVYTYPTKVNGVDDSWLFDRNTSMIYSRQTSTKRKKYNFEFARPELNVDALRLAPALPANNSIQQQFTRVPEVSDVRTLVADLTRGKTQPYDKVQALFNYFSTNNGFTYSQTTGQDTGGSKIVEFLDRKQGYCVQYAAALAWLVRQAGIPARVAFGFTRGGTVDNRGAMTLTNYNLHAWTEVYFDGFGWIPFDATPASAITGSVSPDWALNPSRPINLDEPEDEELPTANPSGGAAGSAAPTDPRGDNSDNIQTAPSSPVTEQWPIWAAIGGLALVLLLASPAWRRASLRRQRLRLRTPAALAVDATSTTGPPGDPVVVGGEESARLAARHDAHQAWDELLDTMIDYQVRVDDAETPRMTAERIATVPMLAESGAESVRLLGQAEERARYAPRPMTSEELRASVTSVRRALSAQASRRTRLVALILPPSVTQRWRAATSRAFTDSINWLGRRRETLGRALSVRRLVAGRAGR